MKWRLPSLDSFGIILNMKTNTLKIVFHRNARTEKNFTASVMSEDGTLKTFEDIDLSGKNLVQCVELLKDKFDILGFLSHNVVIPLAGLIPVHLEKTCFEIA